MALDLLTETTTNLTERRPRPLERYIINSGDPKPKANVQIGSFLREADTGRVWYWDGVNWIKPAAGDIFITYLGIIYEEVWRMRVLLEDRLSLEAKLNPQQIYDEMLRCRRLLEVLTDTEADSL